MKNNFGFPDWWDEGFKDWSLDKMFEKLNSFGISLDKEKFLALTEKYDSSEKLADAELYPHARFSGDDKEEDFVWMASEELWKRLRADKKSLEMISEEIEKPFEEAESLEWERYRHKIVELEQRGFDIFVSHCFDQSGRPKKEFYKELKRHFFDGDYYLCSFQDHLAYLGRWDERLEAGKKLHSLEPENSYFKDLCAEALLYSGYAGEGERLYDELISDFPEEIWHAVHCGDMFFLGYEGMKLSKDFKKAEKYYSIAERRFTEEIDWQDRESIIQRLFDLYRQWGNGQKTEEYRRKREGFERYYLEDMEKPDDFEDTGDLVIDANEKVARSQKIGRNEPCPCGSGKKYKKCCGG